MSERKSKQPQETEERKKQKLCLSEPQKERQTQLTKPHGGCVATVLRADIRKGTRHYLIRDSYSSHLFSMAYCEPAFLVSAWADWSQGACSQEAKRDECWSGVQLTVSFPLNSGFQPMEWYCPHLGKAFLLQLTPRQVCFRGRSKFHQVDNHINTTASSCSLRDFAAFRPFIHSPFIIWCWKVKQVVRPGGNLHLLSHLPGLFSCV